MSFFVSKAARAARELREKTNSPELRVSDFLKINPWVIVEGGSYNGNFDFMPEKYRIGKWHPVAILTIVGSIAALFVSRPDGTDFGNLLQVSDPTIKEIGNNSQHFPPAFSYAWYYNVVAFIFMTTMHAESFYRFGSFPYVTFTVQSWILLTIRHGFIAIQPFLSRTHWVHFVSELLRGPVLISSLCVSIVWNFALLPIIYFKFIKIKEQRRKFLKWNTSFHLVQWHILNVFYAFLNSLSAPRKLIYADLWCMYTFALCYATFYFTVLDRIGIHLYPIFTPRTIYSIFPYMTLIGLIFSIYSACNSFIFSQS